MKSDGCEVHFLFRLCHLFADIDFCISFEMMYLCEVEIFSDFVNFVCGLITGIVLQKMIVFMAYIRVESDKIRCRVFSELP